jgi:hypothetical protein
MEGVFLCSYEIHSAMPLGISPVENPNGYANSPSTDPTKVKYSDESLIIGCRDRKL